MHEEGQPCALRNATPVKPASLPSSVAATESGAVEGRDYSSLVHVHNVLSHGDKPYHGSTSTTFSTGSSTVSSSSDPADCSSAASSSGVATMSSTDHLPIVHSSGVGIGDAAMVPPLAGENHLLNASDDAAVTWSTINEKTLRCATQRRTSADLGPCDKSDSLTIATSSSAITSGSDPAERGYHELRAADHAALCKESPSTSSSTTESSTDHERLQPNGRSKRSITALTATSPLPALSACGTSASQILCTPLRTMVSQNRRRYQQDGFNLDLTYITDRIIAMGYPADTTEALYRNSMSHIVKFLEHYHPGHYKVFNLRGQYVYDTSKFHNRVVSFEMTDHHPPRLELMAPFCREVHEYLDADPRNVVAVHCKAGKGRTGVMICAYLCYINFYPSPRQNMDYYSIVRTHNNKGVTIPSQRRYVYYFAHLRNKKLNYMPQKMELVGIYVERPPKISGPLSKGALKVRVANGDVDVFIGDDMWISAEKWEENEEMHKKYPVMLGDDQYDPYCPQQGKDCISRRCYGWTVPSNKRVFLEGDVRVDIFQKSQLKVLNVNQEKKKIGHVWFNTMFCCSGFCGGQYVHGDEAYPYNEGGSMIVKRRIRRKTPTFSEGSLRKDSPADLHKTAPPSVSPSLPSTPPAQKLRSVATEPATGANTDKPVNGESPKHASKAFEPRKAARSALRLNGIAKKRTDRSPCGNVLSSEKCWSSQDGGLGRVGDRNRSRASLDYDAGEYEEELVVERPPGLDKHCPDHTLKDLYPLDKQPPRQGIDAILREAYRRNLINDLYNARRQSVPREGPVMPKSPVGRPYADGPYCVVRQPDEHVDTYGVLEIDRANKNKEIGMGFKMYIVTRCLDEGNESDLKLAESFLHVTHQKQLEKDKVKKEKVEARFKKLANKEQNSPNQAGISFSDRDMSSADSSTTDVRLEEENSAHMFQEDPRYHDPHLKNFFFRQRVTSKSRHPSQHYHCPLRPKNISVCSSYGCSGVSGVKRRTLTRKPAALLTNEADKPPVYTEGTDADVEDVCENSSSDCSAPVQGDGFDGFDFFQPRSVARMNSHSSSGSSSANNRTLVDRSADEGDPDAFRGGRSVTLTAANAGSLLSAREAAKAHRSHSERSVAGPITEGTAVENTQPTLLTGFENVHPSDCSWATSSSGSSSPSLSDTPPTAPAPDAAATPLGTTPQADHSS
ncbi:daf-18 protein [Aphelenchoides avenae]|nr:daf-18 protein [Aphelenchus avenae]